MEKNFFFKFVKGGIFAVEWHIHPALNFCIESSASEVVRARTQQKVQSTLN